MLPVMSPGYSDPGNILPVELEKNAIGKTSNGPTALTSKNSSRVAGTVNNADNFHSFVADTVKGDVILKSEAPQPGLELIACAACERGRSKGRGDGRNQPVKEAVSIHRAVERGFHVPGGDKGDAVALLSCPQPPMCSSRTCSSPIATGALRASLNRKDRPSWQFPASICARFSASRPSAGSATTIASHSTG